MALVNQIFLALGWKNAVMQTEVCFAVVCFAVFFFFFPMELCQVQFYFLQIKVQRRKEAF